MLKPSESLNVSLDSWFEFSSSSGICTGDIGDGRGGLSESFEKGCGLSQCKQETRAKRMDEKPSHV